MYIHSSNNTVAILISLMDSQFGKCLLSVLFIIEDIVAIIFNLFCCPIKNNFPTFTIFLQEEVWGKVFGKEVGGCQGGLASSQALSIAWVERRAWFKPLCACSIFLRNLLRNCIIFVPNV